MKKIFLIAGIAFSFLITSCNSDADDLLISSEEKSEKLNTLVAPAQAKTAAINFIRGSKQAKGIPDATEENIEEIQILEDESSIPVMYFINLKENSGFVVLSAYIGERPILAYADEGSFDMEKVADYEGVNDWVLTKYL